MEISPFVLIFLSIPEAIGISLFVLAYNKSFGQWKKGIVLGIFLGLSIYLIRLLPVSFGVHTLVFIIIIILAFKLIFDFDLLNIIISVLITILICFLGDTFSYLVITRIFDYPAEIMHQNKLIHTASGWPQVIILLTLSIIIHKKYHLNKGE